MRRKSFGFARCIAGLILSWNLHTIFLRVPDEAESGRHLPHHLFPRARGDHSFIGFYIAMFASVALSGPARTCNTIRLRLPCDGSVAGLRYRHLVTGSLWGRVIWGIWWTWDARLTTLLVCCLLYVGYLCCGRAMDEPTQRGRMSAVLSIFASPTSDRVEIASRWFRTQHPAPVLEIRNGAEWRHEWKPPFVLELLALALLRLLRLVLVRLHQENMQREIDSRAALRCTLSRRYPWTHNFNLRFTVLRPPG